MPDYLFLMHDDARIDEDVAAWPRYISQLKAQRRFVGGSVIGNGGAYRKSGPAGAKTPVNGFIRVEAPSLAAAQKLLAGNPVYEAGGTVEIRELPEG